MKNVFFFYLILFFICLSALASRCLQLVVHFIPQVKHHFEKTLPAKNSNMLKNFEKIVKVSCTAKGIHGTVCFWRLSCPIPYLD